MPIGGMKPLDRAFGRLTHTSRQWNLLPESTQSITKTKDRLFGRRKRRLTGQTTTSPISEL
jgi:hypothetical protein